MSSNSHAFNIENFGPHDPDTLRLIAFLSAIVLFVTFLAASAS